MTDEEKKAKQAEYQRNYRRKLKLNREQVKQIQGVDFSTTGIQTTAAKLHEARLLIHQACAIFAEAPHFGIPEEATNAFLEASKSHMDSVEARPIDVKMMYPAAKKISEIIMASNGFAPIREAVLNKTEELLRSEYDSWEDTAKINTVLSKLRDVVMGRG